MDDFELEIKKEFINEALMNLEEVEGSFMELESCSDPKPLLDKIFRLAHNLKGGSRAVGFGSVAEFTHVLESLVLKIQKGEVTLESEIVTLLLRSNDRLVEMLSALKDNFDAQFENSDLIGELQQWLSGEKKAAVEEPKVIAEPNPVLPTTPVAENATVKFTAESTIEETTAQGTELPPDLSAFDIAEPSADAPAALLEIQPDSVVGKSDAPPLSNPIEKSTESPQKAKAPDSKARKESPDDEVIRVSLSKIDLLNDYVGELIVLQSVVQQQSDYKNAKLTSSIRQVVKLCKDIQSLAMGQECFP